MSREHWSSRLTFILAAVGSAVGLANIWRFPYSVGVSGGAAFVLIYLAAVVLVVLPILIGELLVGRRGQQSPPRAIAAVAAEGNANPAWRFLGYSGLIAAVVIFSFYCVVGGWTLAYAGKALTGQLQQADHGAIKASFDGLNASWWQLLAWASAFWAVVVWVSARGVRAGIESAVKLLMPLLFVMLLGLVVYAALTGDFAAALRFLFAPDFSKVTPRVALDAIGQAFFSIGVGLTNLMAYGAYLGRDTSVPRASLVIIGSDTLVALLAGLAIFPIIFATGLNPTEGPGLVFLALPYAFGQMPSGSVLGGSFFLLLFFAALTSAISMMECSVAWLQDRFGWARRKAALVSGGLSWCLGLLSVFSFNLLADVHPLGDLRLFAGKTFFDLFDYICSTLFMPLSGVLVALLAGWALPKALMVDEWQGDGGQAGWGFVMWRILVRYLAPLGLLSAFYVLVTTY